MILISPDLLKTYLFSYHFGRLQPEKEIPEVVIQSYRPSTGANKCTQVRAPRVLHKEWMFYTEGIYFDL